MKIRKWNNSYTTLEFVTIYIFIVLKPKTVEIYLICCENRRTINTRVSHALDAYNFVWQNSTMYKMFEHLSHDGVMHRVGRSKCQKFGISRETFKSSDGVDPLMFYDIYSLLTSHS